MRALPRIAGSARLTVLAAAAAALLVGGQQALPASGSPEPKPALAPQLAPLPAAQRTPDGVAVAGAVPRLGGLAGPPPQPSSYPIARVTRSVRLYSRPGGRPGRLLGARTEFDSPRVLSVAGTRGRWLGVISSSRPNGHLSWIDRDAPGLRVGRTPYSLHADLSSRALELRRGRTAVATVPVAVGAAGTPTPTGRFAVTDRLSGAGVRAVYGCCIVALSGSQPNPPPGWRDGTRLAIHGTPKPGTVGTASSAGCLRASARAMHVLMRRVPLGAPVFIKD